MRWSAFNFLYNDSNFITMARKMFLSTWCIIIIKNPLVHPEGWKLKKVVVLISTFQAQIWWSAPRTQNSAFAGFEITLALLHQISWKLFASAIPGAPTALNLSKGNLGKTKILNNVALKNSMPESFQQLMLHLCRNAESWKKSWF